MLTYRLNRHYRGFGVQPGRTPKSHRFGRRRSVYGQPGRPATVSIAIFHDPGVPTDSVLLTCCKRPKITGVGTASVTLSRCDSGSSR